MIRVALTGSVGMGKSTTADFFRDEGVPVWDADAAVHRLYAPGGAGVAAVAALVPEAVRDGAVDRDRLRAAVLGDATLLGRLEAAIHPLVAADRAAFLDDCARRGEPIALCDIPLLFETGGERDFDVVIVVTAGPELQRERVLARPGMDEESLARMLARQMPDHEKQARADHVIRTDRGLDAARDEVRRILAQLRGMAEDA
ncbi:MAG: dephospho-CoA kinase [Paracoccaceae bacterium]|nr:MAG: dephospho-CoA kinase [Alphaproteobacteria bacterium]GIX12271.1 MAG: dephospho-CoA kinase [Paracoccaceae bacterium]